MTSSPLRPDTAAAATGAPDTGTAGLVARCSLGGVLMGLANLVPGVSGGTMLLASGIYRDFVDAIASLTRLHIRVRALLVLATVAGTAALAILLGAGLLKDLVVHRRWLMYALFIGLTLGGIPLVWRPVARRGAAYWLGAATGLAAMVGLFLARAGADVGAAESSFVPLLGAGVAGASAMILPGLSGGYLLLLLGQYVPILSGLDRLKDGLLGRDPALVWSTFLEVVLPVGLGVVVGVVLVSNLVQWFFRRYESLTYGVLLGLLLGALVGLWPFQRLVEPEPGVTVVKGTLVTPENLGDIEPEDYPTEVFAPTPVQAGTVLLLVGAGVLATVGIGRLGAPRPRPGSAPED